MTRAQFIPKHLGVTFKNLPIPKYTFFHKLGFARYEFPLFNEGKERVVKQLAMIAFSNVVYSILTLMVSYLYCTDKTDCLKKG